MTIVTTIEELEALYGQPGETSTVKEADWLTPQYRSLMEASPFVALATAGDTDTARATAKLAADTIRIDYR